MSNPTLAISDELIEGRLMQALSEHDVLPYQGLKVRAAAGADDRTVRRVLQGMIDAGQVRRKAERNCLWYLGYAKALPADQEPIPDDIPAPFARLLRELVQ